MALNLALEPPPHRSGRTRDEFRICSQPRCAPAPALRRAGPLPPSRVDKFAALNRGGDDDDDGDDDDSAQRSDQPEEDNSAPAEQQDRSAPLPGGGDPDAALPGKDVEQAVAVLPGAPAQQGAPGQPPPTMEALPAVQEPVGGDAAAAPPMGLSYLETNLPVLRNVEECPTTIVSINLGETDPATGEVSIQSEAEGPGCYTGWIEADITHELAPGGADSSDQDRLDEDEEAATVLDQADHAIGDMITKATAAYYSDVQPFIQSDVKPFFDSGMGYVAAAAVGAALLLGVGLIIAAVILWQRSRREHVPPLVAAEDHSAEASGSHTIGYANPGYRDSDDAAMASIPSSSYHSAEPCGEPELQDSPIRLPWSEPQGSPIRLPWKEREMQDSLSCLPVNSHPILHSLEPTPRADMSCHHTPRML